MKTDIKQPCGNSMCCASTGICGRITFGCGKLDDYGYWQIPCEICARAYEKEFPGQEAWPSSKKGKMNKGKKRYTL